MAKSKFSRRHYDAVAVAMAEMAKPLNEVSKDPLLDSLTDEQKNALCARLQSAAMTSLIRLFERDNPNFDKTRFMEAHTKAYGTKLRGMGADYLIVDEEVSDLTRGITIGYNEAEGKWEMTGMKPSVYKYFRSIPEGVIIDETKDVF